MATKTIPKPRPLSLPFGGGTAFLQPNNPPYQHRLAEHISLMENMQLKLDIRD